MSPLNKMVESLEIAANLVNETERMRYWNHADTFARIAARDIAAEEKYWEGYFMD